MTHRHQRLNRFLRPQRFLSWLCLGLLISLLSAIIADRSLGSIAPSASGPVLEEVAQNSLEADIHDAFAEGEQAYEQQDYGTAIALWQSLLPQANLQQQVALLNNISLAQQALRQWSEAEQTIRQSLTLLDWQAEDSDPSETTLLASALDIYGQWLYHQGQTEAALDLWVQAEQYYPANTPNILGAIVQNQLNQAQALQYLGRHLDSQTLLSNLHAQLQNPPLNLSVDTQLDILLNFGRILRLVGNLDNGTPNALAILQDAEKLVADSNSNRLSALQLELGNIQQAIAQYYRSLAANSNRNSEADGFTAQAVTASTAAINHYQQAISTATEPLQRIQAQLNQLSLLINAADHRGIGTLVANLQQDLEQLSLSDRPSLQARLAFARQALKLREMDSPYAPGGTEIANLLVTVINQAKTLNDTRLISSAWGSLGHLYEINYQARGQKSDLPDALNATSNGLTAILNEQQPEQSYRLHWQLGRILKVQGETEGAIAAYDAAIKTIQSLRRELVILNPDIQFSFRQDIEPVYREFADLLLKEGQPSQENLKHAREVIDSLQTLEVENYLRQSCSNATLGEVDRFIAEQDPTAAFLYTIMLGDRLEVIVKLPNQTELINYKTLESSQSISFVIDNLRGEIENSIQQNFQDIPLSEGGKLLSNRLYDWLIQPIQLELKGNEIQTLVFVLDSALRDIPIAALFDGEKFLIEQDYAITIVPGLQLLNAKSSDLANDKVAAFSLADMRNDLADHQNWSDLRYVNTELSEISRLIDTEVFAGQAFTQEKFRQEANHNPASIFHIATHAKFGARQEESFILVWDGTISLRVLGDYLLPRDSNLQNPIQLAVLSACETAAGNGQATLGIAGFAVQSGVRSVVASLWAVNDASTSELMTEFYSALLETNSKAAALKQAQQQLLKDGYNPYHWSAFTVIGNWL